MSENYPRLSYGVGFVIVCLAVLIQYRLACERQMGGQTDRRTNRLTHDDSIYRASIASRGKILIKVIVKIISCNENIANAIFRLDLTTLWR